MTYSKKNHKTGRTYYGKTSGAAIEATIDAINKILEKRDNHHHKNKEGYDIAKIDKVSTDSDAIRGREQMLIEKSKTEDKSGNIYNSISPRNPKRARYLKAALIAFGEISMYVLFYHFH